MKIAVWTKSPPKLEALNIAFSGSPYFKWEKINFISEKIKSWVSDMPLTLDETITWAYNRALNIKEFVESENNQADYYIGMEWWSTMIGDKAYLFWVMCILNTEWEHHSGISNMIEIPSSIQKRLYENKEDLWPIMDEVLWLTGTKKWKWATAYWSDDTL